MLVNEQGLKVKRGSSGGTTGAFGRSESRAGGPWRPEKATPTLPHSHTPTLPHSHTPTLPHSHTPTLPHSHTPTTTTRTATITATVPESDYVAFYRIASHRRTRPASEDHNFHPHPHYRAPCMKYVEGSIRPIYMCRPRRKYVIPGP